MRTGRTPVRDSAPTTVPQRTCVGCRRTDNRTALLRVVADTRDVTVYAVPDLRGRAPGRGAWLHPTSECFGLARRRRAFARALHINGPIDDQPVAAYLDDHAHLSCTTDRERVDTPMSTR